MTTETMRAPQPLAAVRTERKDRWWLAPLLVVLGLGTFIVYSTWAAFVNEHYYVAPYLSPFYSPCLSANCQHISLPIVGTWWTLTPAILVLWIPLGFRTTCYYYRRAYYRAFFWAPPACAVRDLPAGYKGETRFPFTLQNIHRYFFWLSLPVLAFLWWDAINAFRFPTRAAMTDFGGTELGLGIGTLVLIANAALLSLYSLSCHSCRHLCGGHLDAFHRAPARYGLWRIVTRLNERHMNIAWASLIWVGLTDLYIRLLSMGIIQDVRFF